MGYPTRATMQNASKSFPYVWPKHTILEGSRWFVANLTVYSLDQLG